MEKTKFLIIGSGPGGALTAKELRKHYEDVIMIESGSHLSLDSCKPYSTQEMEQKYKYGGLNPTINNPKISYVEGQCVGGGSEVNSGFYHRTPKKIIESWKKDFQIKDFSFNNLLEHFKIIENEINVSYLPKSINPAKASLKLKEGADKLGWKSMEVPRWIKYDKNGHGVKQSMTQTYVKWYLEYGGKLISNLKAYKIVRNESNWVVLCRDTNSNQINSISTKYLFLCGGAINTPFLLKSSGIHKNIGKTLQMHPTVKAVAEFDEIINFKDMGVPVHQIKEFSPLISFGCSISSKNHLALALLDNKKYLTTVSKNWENMAIYYAMIRPQGQGRIIKVPFFKDPLVSFNLKKTDLEVLSDGLTKMCKILFEAGAKRIYPSIKNFGVINDEKSISKIPKVLSRNKVSLMTIHLFSSCPMGENKNICSVDSYGRLFGYDNIYVNDGSLLPNAPGVNPQGTIMAIARRNILNFIKNLKQ